MKYEYYIYSRVGSSGEIEKKIEALPSNVKEESIKDVRLDLKYSIWVDAQKKDVIKFLDKYFEIENKNEVQKIHNIEISNKEIGDYLYFIIMPKDVRLGKGLQVELKMPKCQDPCPIGGGIKPPIIISPQKCKTIGINEVYSGVFFNYELLLSAVLKELFDVHNITGLQYQQCEIVNQAEINEEVLRPYHANVEQEVYEVCDSIEVFDWYCRKHRIMHNFYSKNIHMPSKSLSDLDFQVIRGVMCDGEIYYYRRPKLIAKRGVIEVLHKNKIKGLSNNNFFSKTKFKPLIISN